MAVVNGANVRRAYPEETWEAMKPTIIQKYIHEGLTLDQTMDALKAQGFMATEKMYKTRIKKWKLTKYIKDDKAIAILSGADDSLHRAHTISGRPITKEEAERHIKRKKRPSTWNSEQPQTEMGKKLHLNRTLMPPENVVPDSDFLTSPVNEFNQNFDFSDPLSAWPAVDGFDRRGTLMNGVFSPPMVPEDVEDVDTDMMLTDLATGNNDALALAEDGRINPQLLATNGLRIMTEMFLHNMRDFADVTLQYVQGGQMQIPSLANQRFNKLWDHFCTEATHMQQGRMEQALIVRDQAQSTFELMLTGGDPWLLLSLCLILNDNLSNPDRVAMSSSFLNEMANWAENVAPNHPISELVRCLQQSDDARGGTALYLLEGTIRMLYDHLKQTIGAHHDLSIEIARLHSRIMTSANMHASAIALLSEDLAVVENHYGASSLPNLLRRSSLARCHFMANEHDKSLDIYQKILADPLLDEPYLADIKYGAMYFIAKSNAQLGNLDQAIAQAQQALIFSNEARGPDHYWASNARDMIREFQASQRSIFEIFGTKVRDGFQLGT